MDRVRASYVKGFVRLSLWYVGRVLPESGESFAEVVNRRVNIYRNTSFYDGKHHPSREDVGPEWAGVLEALEAVYRREDSSEGFETAGLELLWPYLEARLKEVRDGSPSTRPYECWTFDYDGQGRLNIHISNVYQPLSPLSEMYVPFAASLIRLMRESRARRPEVATVTCGSWLNALPPFRALFPERWARSAVVNPEVRYTMGYWGQFTDRQGDFHSRNGARLRETGAFPFPSTRCECGIEKALAHLESCIPEAVRHNANREDGEVV